MIRILAIKSRRSSSCAATSALTGGTEHPFELEEDVWQREEIVTTGVGFGVAIPHTKSQWIRHSSISIARLAKPIGWQSEMGEVELVIMLTLGC
ncbi:multiphosphoryl transfer protein 1 [includes phosphoenolpyruvate-protein phosphotransferase;phosphocarrier protein Hp; fructose-like phosphotransferase enzyme IIA component] [Escherichia coli]|nr:multiphosphoryl transfer protein 1 [includes phosphoenolpyruvate-protein phosphotransferase;phosphocarrier protein Hp; fructose-like phosphotransferase enzyme IIA component] [Escherichia coli]